MSGRSLTYLLCQLLLFSKTKEMLRRTGKNKSNMHASLYLSIKLGFQSPLSSFKRHSSANSVSLFFIKILLFWNNFCRLIWYLYIDDLWKNFNFNYYNTDVFYHSLQYLKATMLSFNRDYVWEPFRSVVPAHTEKIDMKKAYMFHIKRWDVWEMELQSLCSFSLLWCINKTNVTLSSIASAARQQLSHPTNLIVIY